MGRCEISEIYFGQETNYFSSIKRNKKKKRGGKSHTHAIIIPFQKLLLYSNLTMQGLIFCKELVHTYKGLGNQIINHFINCPNFQIASLKSWLTAYYRS